MEGISREEGSSGKECCCRWSLVVWRRAVIGRRAVVGKRAVAGRSALVGQGQE